MKAIIQIQNKSLHNTLTFFSKNILDLEICGKKLLSYYFDILNELEVEDIFIFSEDIREFIPPFYLSKVFSPNIHLITNQSLKKFKASNQELFHENDILTIKNIGFIFGSNETIKSMISEQTHGFTIEDADFILKYIRGNVSNLPSINTTSIIRIKSIQTVEDYITVTNSILKDLDKIDYAIGYSQSQGIVVGKNVTINKNVTLIAPLVIQDDVNISEGCVLGPNVIISNHVFIEEQTNISNTTVYDNTYIGRNLQLNNKLIMHNHVIDKINLYKYQIDSKLISKNN